MADPRVSIVIPTFNRAALVGHAVDSALGQTVPCDVVVCDHGSADDTPRVIRGFGSRVRYLRREEDAGPFFCWLDGVLHARGQLVHINYDDDWIDPRFVERTLALVDDGCGFAVTDAMIHADDGRTNRAHAGIFPEGVNDARLAENYLLRSPLTLSPGCALFRREDVVDGLLVGRTPFGGPRYHGAGPDLLIFLMAILRHDRFGFADEPLAHFRAHEGSITTRAMAGDDTNDRLSAAYLVVKQYYLVLKWAQRTRLPTALWRVTSLRLWLQRRLRSLTKRLPGGGR
jgi:glycosyltransferase involved in cell wall biosynthesis